jgi:hypothetical protein
MPLTDVTPNAREAIRAKALEVTVAHYRTNSIDTWIRLAGGDA